jgi:type IV pilus assembly protein PilM
MGLFGSNEITGIDIGAGSIKAVRIKPGKQPALTAAGMIEFPPGSERGKVSADLQQLLTERKIGRGNIITQMPGRDLTIRALSLPKMPLEELREAVRWEAKRHISYALDAALVEYLVLGESRNGAVEKYDILMVAAEQSRISEHLAPFDEARLKVSAVDASALALRNALRLRKETSGAVLVVDIGAGKTEINIFKDGNLRFSRCLETGGADITRLIADDMAVEIQAAEELKRNADVLAPAEEDRAVSVIAPSLDALLMEVRRSVEYYKTSFREKGVDRALLTGGTALMKGLPDYVSQALGHPVEVFDPFGALALSDAIREEFGPAATRFSAAVGLALRQA